jgi:WD40 repeat protein
LWDSSNCKAKLLIRKFNNDAICIAFNPDGKNVIIGTYSGYINIWDTESGALISTIDKPALPINSLAVSPDGNMMASVQYGIMTVWNTLNWKPIYKRDDLYLSKAAFSGDGKTIVAVGNTINLLDAGNGSIVSTFVSDNEDSYPIAFSFDANLVAMESEEHTLLIVDAKTGKLVSRAQGNYGINDASAFSQDGKIVAAECDDDLIRLWDVHTGKLVSVLGGTYDYANSISFNPDGHTFAAVSEYGTVFLWDLSNMKSE